MGLKALLSIPFAKYIRWKTQKWSKNPIKTQERVLQRLIKTSQSTDFGKDHHFKEIKNYTDFKKNVPVRDYEQLSHYIEKIKEGKRDVLWPGLPIYFSKTSGTTSGTKYIPITKESIPFHLNGARDSILHYIAETKNAAFVSKKMIFLQGSPELDTSGIIPTGRQTAIIAHHCSSIPPTQ